MIARSLVYDSQLRLAHHYVEKVIKANADYLSGFERSLKAVELFDKERLQIENTVNWLIRYADGDEAGLLLIKLLRETYPLLYARLETTELQRWLECGLEVAQRLGDKEAEAAHLLALGFAKRRTVSLEVSQPQLEQATALARQQDNPRLLLRCLSALARCYKDQWALDKAADCNQEAYAISKQVGDALGMYQYFDFVGYLFYVENRFEDALDAYEQAYAWALKTGGYRQIGVVLTLMSNIHYLQGQYQEAISKLRQALDFSMVTQYPPVVIYTLHVLGNTLLAAHDYKGAQDAYLRGLHLAEQSHLTENAAIMRAELGVLAYRQNDLRLSFEYLENALEQFREVGDNQHWVLYNNYLVALYVARSDDANAEHALREGLELSAQLSGDPRAVHIIWSAILVWMRRAARDDMSSEQQQTLAETAARWMGFVTASPHLILEDHEIIKPLLVQMNAILGDERLNAFLKEGEQLDAATAIAQIRIELE